MKDGKKGCVILVLPHASVVKKTKLAALTKLRNDTKKLNPN
jgi:hypothetical protein